MSYVALARKWRPRTFSELLGQNHLTSALINSLNQQRIHHAYLFTGTRGVGKTSVARLFAKALNCERGISSEPCLQCPTCLAVEQGRFIDLIEIDGASKTRVEDTRDILENVQYVPTSGRFKIYLIDEVHMLSQHSFNALLKTLEEPPAHVKFLLATTDQQKLPITVLSRCLQFNLKCVSDDVIANHLQHILQQETLPFEPPALALLAKAAKGSMRDALSLLDQAIVSSGNELSTQHIKTMLGVTQQDYALCILQALVALDPQQLITISHQINQNGGYFRYVLDEVLSYLHQMAVIQALPQTNELITTSPEIQLLSTQLTPEDTQLMYQIVLKGMDDLLLAPTMAIGFDMTVLRMYTFRPAAQQGEPIKAYQLNDQVSDKHDGEFIEKTNVAPVAVKKETTLGQQFNPEPTEINKTVPELSWPTILSQLNLRGLTLSAAENAQLISKSSGRVVLQLAKAHQSLFTPPVLARIEEALSRFYNETIRVVLECSEQMLSSPAVQKKISKEKVHQAAEEALHQDPFFQQLQDEFSAELLKNSITSLKEDA